MALVKPEKWPVGPPFGPKPRPLAWAGPEAAAEKAMQIALAREQRIAEAALGFAYGLFAEAFEREVASVVRMEAPRLGMGTGGPKYAWRSLVPDKGRCNNLRAGTARPFRWLARRALELRGIVLIARDEKEPLDLLIGRLNDLGETLGEPPEFCAVARAECAELLEGLAGIAGDVRAELGSRVLDAPVALARAEGILSAAIEGRARAEKADAQDAQAQWREWAAAAFQGGAGKAHRWSKLPQVWRPTVVSREGAVAADPVALLRGESGKFQTLLDATEEPAATFDPSRGTLPRPGPDETKQVAASFRSGTAQTHDGFHVRQFKHASGGALRTVGALLQAVEALGTFPEQIRMAPMALFAKPKGGFIGIGVYPSMCRVWAKARRPYCTQWELSHRRAYVAASMGKSCVDVVWRQSLAAESGVADGKAGGAFLWDMHQVYDEHSNRAVNLGIDFICGKSRCTIGRRGKKLARTGAAHKRRGRMARLKRCTLRGLQLGKAGCMLGCCLPLGLCHLE